MLQIVIYKFHILPTLCFVIVLKGLIFQCHVQKELLMCVNEVQNIYSHTTCATVCKLNLLKFLLVKICKTSNPVQR